MWRCKSNYCSAVASCNGYVDVTSGSEDSLLDALVNVGPIRCNNADHDNILYNIIISAILDLMLH